MEQNTTETQIEDTSGLRGFKLIKRYLARTYGIGPEARQKLFGKPEAMALTKQQSLFLIGIGILSYIITCGFFLTLPFCFIDPTVDFSLKNHPLAYIFWLVICSHGILMPLAFLAAPLFMRTGGDTKEHTEVRTEETSGKNMTYFLVVFLLILFYIDLNSTSDINKRILFLTFLPMLLIRMFAYEIRDNAKLKACIGKSEKLVNSIGERLNKVFRIKS